MYFVPCFGMRIPWAIPPAETKRRFDNPYALSPAEEPFATTNGEPWVQIECGQEASFADARNAPVVRAAFVVHGSKDRVAIDYVHVNDHLCDTPFRKEQSLDLAPQLRPDDSLFKADLCDGHCHPGICADVCPALTFCVGRRFFIPIALNFG